MKKTTKTTLLIVLVMIALLGTVGTVFAYWISGVGQASAEDSGFVIDIEEAPVANTALVVTTPTFTGENKILSPENDALVFTALVSWETDDDYLMGDEVFTGTVSAEVTNEDADGVINVAIAFANTTLVLDGDTVAVTITVTMDFDNVTKDNISKYSNKQLEVNLQFSLAMAA